MSRYRPDLTATDDHVDAAREAMAAGEEPVLCILLLDRWYTSPDGHESVRVVGHDRLTEGVAGTVWWRDGVREEVFCSTAADFFAWTGPDPDPEPESWVPVAPTEPPSLPVRAFPGPPTDTGAIVPAGITRALQRSRRGDVLPPAHDLPLPSPPPTPAAGALTVWTNGSAVVVAEMAGMAALLAGEYVHPRPAVASMTELPAGAVLWWDTIRDGIIDIPTCAADCLALGPGFVGILAETPA